MKTFSSFGPRSFGLPLAALTLACAAQAQDGQPPGPPPEAVQACVGQTEGASVSFTLKDGKALTGTCRKLNGQLVAMPPRMDRKPPASAN